MKHDTTEAKSHPRLNWLKKPGEPIQWYKVEYVDGERRDIPITADEAYRIAGLHDGVKR